MSDCLVRAFSDFADLSEVVYYAVDDEGNYMERFETDFTQEEGRILIPFWNRSHSGRQKNFSTASASASGLPGSTIYWLGTLTGTGKSILHRSKKIKLIQWWRFMTVIFLITTAESQGRDAES